MKRYIFMFVSPGNVEIIVVQCGKINRVLVAYFPNNTSAIVIKIRQFFLNLQLQMSGIVFMGHSLCIRYWVNNGVLNGVKSYTYFTRK